jgi:membrane protease YdiL (CAAX protease family)
LAIHSSSRFASVVLAALVSSALAAAAQQPAPAPAPPPAPPPAPTLEPAATPAPALTPEPAPTPPRFTRGQALAYGLISSAFALGSLGVDYLPDPGLFGFAPHSSYHYGTEVAASVPLVFVSPLDAVEVGGVQIGMAGGAIALRDLRANDSRVTPYFVVAELLSLHQAIYAAYATYRDARAAGASDAWKDGWRPWSAGELLVAPLHLGCFRRPIVGVSLSIQLGFVGLATSAYLATKPVASTAARDSLLGLPIALSAGVTEEALFRGFLYEELKLSLGRWPAHFIDMTLFTLAHVPGEVGLPDSQIATGLVSRALVGLLLGLAYDDGGLPESVMLHTLWDAVTLTYAGLTGQHSFGTSLLSGGPPASRWRGATPPAFVVPIVSGSL